MQAHTCTFIEAPFLISFHIFFLNFFSKHSYVVGLLLSKNAKIEKSILSAVSILTVDPVCAKVLIFASVYDSIYCPTFSLSLHLFVSLFLSFFALFSFFFHIFIYYLFFFPLFILHLDTHLKTSDLLSSSLSSLCRLSFSMEDQPSLRLRSSHRMNRHLRIAWRLYSIFVLLIHSILRLWIHFCTRNWYLFLIYLFNLNNYRNI